VTYDNTRALAVYGSVKRMADPDLKLRLRSLIPSRKEFIKTLVQIGVGLALTKGGNFTYENAIRVVAILYAWAVQHSLLLGVLLGSVVILAIGVGLFWIRARFPIVYGSTEAFVGIFAAMNAIARADFNNFPDLGVVIQCGGSGFLDSRIS
jgi:hypothetical protein